MNYFEINIQSNDKIDIQLISERIRIVRNYYNETLREFSKRLNTTCSTISAYKTGKALIFCAFLIEICKFSNISAD